MPYIQKKWITGKVIEKEKYYSSRYGKRYIKRSPNKLKTPEKMLLINERNAEKRLRRLMNANFKHMDQHIVLTYRRGDRPPPDKAKDDLEKFMRKLRTRFKKMNKLLKYVTVTEYKKKAIHHHIVITSIDPREVQLIWPHGKAKPTSLDDTGQYGLLAAYLIKETKETFKNGVTKKRWCQSRNMTKPKQHVDIIKRTSFRKYPKAEKGYYIETDKMKSGVHDLTGCEYQFYSMVKIE